VWAACIVCSASGTELMNGDVDELRHGNQQSDVSADGRDLVNSDVTGTLVVECDSFCDFVRFEGTVTEQCVPASRSTSHDAASAALLRTCIEKYKLLFEALVEARVLHCSQSLSASFMDRFVSLEALAASCDKADDKTVSPAVVRCADRVELTGLTKTMIESFSLACQLLVDFSALPIYTESTLSSPADIGPGKNTDFDK